MFAIWFVDSLTGACQFIEKLDLDSAVAIIRAKRNLKAIPLNNVVATLPAGCLPVAVPQIAFAGAAS